MFDTKNNYKKRGLSEASKIIIPLYVSFVLVVVSVFVYFIPLFKNELVSQKKILIQELTSTAYSVLKTYDQKVRSGELSENEARKKAKEQIRTMRYGPELKDYFWIIDQYPRMVMHPYSSGLEGKSLKNFKDPEGKKVFVEILRIVNNQGSGFVDYMWQWKDNPQRIVPKISFAQKVPFWNWIVGTGIYIEDVNGEIKAISWELKKVFALIFFLLLLISFYISNQAVKIERKRISAQRAKDLEELRLKKLLVLSQMTEESVDQVTEFALEQAVELTNSKLGYLGFLNKQETQITINNWSKQVKQTCPVSGEVLNHSIRNSNFWGEVVQKRKPLIVNDDKVLESRLKKNCPTGHLKINRHMNVPVFDGRKIVAIAGVGNKDTDYIDSDARQLKLMMDGMWKIIQKKNADQALKESEERYRLLADNATDNIWIRRLPDLDLEYISPSVEKMMGYSPEEFKEIPLKQHLSEKSYRKIYEKLSKELENDGKEGRDPGQSFLLELEQTKKDGTTFWTEIKARFLRDLNGRPDRILGITRNIDERKHLERKLRQTQKMEALGTLSGGIAHDFNNILSSLFGFTELAKLEAENNEELQNNLDEIMSAGMRAKELVRHILTFSRKADFEKNLLSIRPLIKESLKFLTASIPADIEIRQDFKVADALVMADPTHLHQIFMNLFTNAAHAMKGTGGVLEVSMDSIIIEEDEITRINNLMPGNYVKISISDSGCGIPKSLLDRIFEPFFTTKKRGEGTGMGLSTVYGILKDLGGTITVYSEVDMGTTFRILLPEQKQAKAETDNTAVRPLKKGEGKILVVDDEESIIEWNKKLLQRLGYEITAKTGSLEALSEFEKDPVFFDLVITDMAMPQMNGIELSKKLLSLNPEIPVILCTGFSEGLTKESFIEAGGFDLLMKPLIASELSDVVDRGMRK